MQFKWLGSRSTSPDQSGQVSHMQIIDADIPSPPSDDSTALSLIDYVDLSSGIIPHLYIVR